VTSGVTFTRLKRASFTHSAIYLALLTVWLIPGLHPWEFAFGLAHGLGWIAMSLACVYAARQRIISVRLAVAVVVIGGIGPFVGSLEFVRARRAAEAR
jgi:lauroyl/myristoyl acyltransferase